MTGRGKSYVFKSSKKMAQLAINMDQNQLTKCPLMEEPAYFDGMHKHCQGWQTHYGFTTQLVAVFTE